MSAADPALHALWWLRGYLAGRTGVLAPDDRPEFVQSRLAPVLRKHALPDLPALVETVRAGNRGLIGEVVDALTTHETSFFRDADVYGWLESDGLASLVGLAAGRELAVWSAACSTGQEALSVAMLLLERWPELPFRVHGTDVSPGVIERARSGTYGMLEVNRGLPARRLARWFRRVGIDYVAHDALRARVSYTVHNLVTRGGPTGPFDLVLLRNVLIYLGESDREAVFRHLAAAMRPGAVMVLGTAENLIEPPSGLFVRERGTRISWLVRARGERTT